MKNYCILNLRGEDREKVCEEEEARENFKLFAATIVMALGIMLTVGAMPNTVQ